MHFKFKKYPYQSDACDALVQCFGGQAPASAREDVFARIEHDHGLLGKKLEEVLFTGNKLDLSPEDLVANMQDVQKAHNLHPSKDFTLPDGKAPPFPNFSVEMETGTGKTYVYTKSMFELYKAYGWSKFIIMVPSVAIREGVHSSLQSTQQHFFEQFGKKLRYFIYDTKNKSNMKHIGEFATSKEIYVMIINYQAFAAESAGDTIDKASRKIYQKNPDSIGHMLPWMKGDIRPIDILKSVRPILIIDEPQKFGVVAEKKLIEFNPLFAVRYSATPKKMDIKTEVVGANGKKKSKKVKREMFPKIYRLDAVDAYTNKLVKKIGVTGIEVLGIGGASSYIFFDRIVISKDTYPVAYLEIEVRQENGTPKKIRKVTGGDDLFSGNFSKGLPQYKGYIVKADGIDARDNTITFTNGVTLTVGQVQGDISQIHKRRIQIRETIRVHIEKEQQMFDKGIKVLSLFFIDQVSKYRAYDSDGKELLGQAEYEKIFEEEYAEAISQRDLFHTSYNDYLASSTPAQVHQGYFSIDKKGNMIDSKKARGQEGSGDVSAYDLIMKKKEQLLSFDEPVRFIFSHSALREGRDNPNVFQICTLKQSSSDDSRKQELGRGLRICVNQDGQRMDSSVLGNAFFEYNTLTVIPSESYKDFADGLQKEVKDSLSDRPTVLTSIVINERVLINENKEEFVFDEILSNKFIRYLDKQGYLDDDFMVTEKFVADAENEVVHIPEFLKGFEKEAIDFVMQIHQTASYTPAHNNADTKEFPGDKNKNFDTPVFQALREHINRKTSYTLVFDTDELIQHSIQKINTDLRVSTLVVKVTKGQQSSSRDKQTLADGVGFVAEETATYKTEKLHRTTAYDLIGEIASQTHLKRKTIVSVLQGLREDVFRQFYQNPEEFIRCVSTYIIEQKSTTLVQSILYKPNGQIYNSDLFTINQLKGSLKDNILHIKKIRAEVGKEVKSIHDYIKVDSKGERAFSQAMEESKAVLVYAKIPSGPSGYQIPTPLGNYSPDRAVAFDDNMTGIKYVYFVAETKGNMSDLQLKAIEKGKGKYAEKHFEALAGNKVKYKIVDSFDKMAEEVGLQ